MSFHRDAMHEIPAHLCPPLVPGSRSEERILLAAMVGRILAIGPRSGAEALRLLRASFPESPLVLRVAALEQTMGRRTG